MQRALPVVVMAALLVVGLPRLGTTIAPIAANAHGGTLTRMVDESSFASDGSATVTAAVNALERKNFTVVEELSPDFALVGVVNADSVDSSGVRDGNDELPATYGDRENVTLIYGVTVTNNTTATTHDLTGYGDSGLEDIRVSTIDDEETSASFGVGASVIQSVNEAMFEPGESTIVRVKVNRDRVANFTLIEAFTPVFDSVTIVDANGADFSGVRDANDELFTTYSNYETVSLAYEVTAADDGDVGAAYQFDGFADVNGSEAVTGGADELNVQSRSDDDDNWGLTWSVDDETLDPGKSAVVSVEITGDEAANFTVVEEFNPGLAPVKTVNADDAGFSGVHDASDELFTTYGGRENVTPQYRVIAGESVDEDASYRLSGFTQSDADGKEISVDGIEMLVVSSDDDVGGGGGGGDGGSDDDDDDRDGDDNDESDDDDTDDRNSDTPESMDFPDDDDDDDIGDDSDDSNDDDDDSGGNDDLNDGDGDDTGDGSDDSNDGDNADDGSDGSGGDSGGTPETTTDDNAPATTTVDMPVPGFGVSVVLAAPVIGSVLLAHQRVA